MTIKAWAPTSNLTINITNVSQVVLSPNNMAILRILQPETLRPVWLGLDEPAVVGAGFVVAIFSPWREKTMRINDLIFQGTIHAIHNYGPDVTIRMWVCEGVEVP